MTSTEALLDQAHDPLAVVLAMCERGRTALVRAASVVEAREVLAGISTLEHAVKVRDMNQEAVVAASTLRIRAERRVGELLAAQPKAKPGPRSVDDSDRSPTLQEAGITKDESSTYQRLAKVPEPTFDQAVERVATDALEGRRAVTREAVLREIDPTTTDPEDRWKDGDRFKSACDLLADRAPGAIDAIRWGHFPSKEQRALETTALTLALHAARAAIDRVDAELTKRRNTR